MNSHLFLVHRSENGDGVFAARLKLGEQVIGRSVENDICLALDTISRSHARIDVDHSRVTITDLGSRNGTWINRQRVSSVTVFPGQRIRFGNVSMVLSPDPSGVCGLDPEEETHDARSQLLSATKTPVPLPAAQTRVLELFAAGMMEKQVATQLNISPHTVHNHARKIYEAYDVRSRVELLLKLFPRSE